MGVPLLLTWLRRYFSKCFTKPEAMGPQDHLYVDLNSLLYPAVNIAADALLQRLAAAEATGTGGGGMFLHQKGSSSASTASAVSVKEAEDAILAALVTLLEKLCSICPPQKLLYIASDGVSPMGKMSHQRARRQNSTARSAARRLCDVTGFDITMLTCGSSFMARVTHASHYFATMYVERINSKRHAANCLRQHNNPNEGSSSSAAPLLTAVVVDATSPGEGEHKIFEAIRAFRSFESYDHNVTHCVCSSDTDVVVSALTLHEPFLYALRFDPSGPHEPTAFSIEAFRAALYERLQPRTLDDFEKALHDFVFVILLFGNDFLPRIADVADIAEGALDAFIKFLADNFVSRGKRLVDEVTGVVHVEAAVYLFDFLEDLPGKSKASSLSIEFGSGGDGDTENPWELPQPATGGGGGVDDLSEIAAAKEQAIRQQCFAYWTMLQWAMQYSCGPVPMWNAAYPYSTVPNIAQLRKYCGMDVETVKVRGVPDEPLDVFAQLLILTPPHSVQRVLPPALRYTSSDKISVVSGASPVDDVATILARSFEDIPMSDVVAWCKSRVSRLTPEEQRRHENYARGGVPAAFFWDPVAVKEELTTDAATAPKTASSATSVGTTKASASFVGGLPPILSGNFLMNLNKSGTLLSSLLPGLGGVGPSMAPLVGAGVSKPAITSETIVDECGSNDTAMIISSAGFMTTPTFSFDYTPLPAGATLSSIEGATFTQLSPFSSTSEIVHLTRGAHHRKVFLRFVACDGSDVGASLPKSTASISSSTTHHDHNHNVDVRKAQSYPFWKPLPNCTSKVVRGASHDEEAGHRRTTAAKRARDDNDDGLLNGGGGGGGGDDNMSSTGMFGGSFDVAPPAAAAGSKPSFVGSSSTSDRAEKQRQELLQRRQQAQRELEEARETVRANAALKK